MREHLIAKVEEVKQFISTFNKVTPHYDHAMAMVCLDEALKWLARKETTDEPTSQG